jgi:hypothetical protein
MNCKIKLKLFPILSLLITILITIILTSCGTPEKRTPPPVEKNTKTFAGKAIIVEVVDAKNGAGNDYRNYMEIYFNFIPADPDDRNNYLCRKCPDNRIRLFYDNRENFHRNWINKWDIKKGDEYKAIRHELIRNDGTFSVSHEVLLEPKK